MGSENKVTKSEFAIGIAGIAIIFTLCLYFFSSAINYNTKPTKQNSKTTKLTPTEVRVHHHNGTMDTTYIYKIN